MNQTYVLTTQVLLRSPRGPTHIFYCWMRRGGGLRNFFGFEILAKRDYFGSLKKTQGFFWVLYFSSVQINNNISTIYCLCGIFWGDIFWNWDFWWYKIGTSAETPTHPPSPPPSLKYLSVAPGQDHKQHFQNARKIANISNADDCKKYLFLYAYKCSCFARTIQVLSQ